ncbi:MAG: hypothetical protein ATN36_05995 [Epulopiscium sp. Nele67-Bin005]|nr:MAG: hypothetical protein ATN36_05995 [Epulopiscium sp. Nele67-Bin005]
MKNLIKIILPTILIVICIIMALNIGSIELTTQEMLQVVFGGGEGNRQIEIVRITRIPSIFIALLGGTMLAVSGVLLQAVMKNPLADPSIIGITSGASFGVLLATTLFPSMLFLEPLFALIFGLLACGLIYGLAWKGTLNPVRVILAGVAINTLFSGLESFVSYMTSSALTSALGSISTTGQNMNDVKMLCLYFTIGIISSFLLYKKCNVLGLGEHNAHSLGINVDKTRLLISLVAVFMAIIPTIYIGPISFVGLIIPHIGRKVVGNNHKYLILYSGLLGGALLICADVISRSIIYPIEIPLNTIMALLGGPFFLYMIRKGDTYAG